MAKSGQHGGNVLQMAEQYGLTPDSKEGANKSLI